MLIPISIARSGFIASGNVGWPHIASGAIRSGDLGITAGTPNGSLFLRDDFAWASVGGGGLTSGQVGSGIIASGAVQGFFGTTRDIASGTVGVFDFGSGAVVAGTVGSGAIQGAVGALPNIASGTIGTNDIGSGQVQSGNIGSGDIAWSHLSSGSVRGQYNSITPGARHIASGSIGTLDVGSGGIRGNVAPGGAIFGHIASGTIDRVNLASGLIVSGVWVGSGAIMGQAGGGPFNIASGTLDNFDLSSGIITSGVYIGSGTILGQAGGGPFNIASGTIGTFDIGSGAIRSGHIASGQVANFAIGSGAVTSGRIGMGGTPTGTNFFRDDFTWASPGAASVSSGAVTQITFASGAGPEYLMAFVSGLNNPFSVITEETVSGIRAVSISQSGHIRVAMAGTSGRMPAIGVVLDNVASGIQANVYTFGDFQFSSGLADYSGWVGTQLFVGRSGQIVSVSGSFNSGGLLSGDVTQPIGVALNSGAAQFAIATTFPVVLGLITSGMLASGNISQFDIASGAINSGQISSGAVQGFFGATRNIASGTVGVFDFGSGAVIAGTVGSGAIQSGQIASGSIGINHFASGAITSGWVIGSGALFGRLGPEFLIASGTVGTFDIGSGQIVSGLIASGQIGHFHVAANAIQSGQVASGAILGQAGGGSFNIASGTITTNDIGSGAIVSGLMASGQVGSYHFVSGAQVDWSQYVLANSSGPSRFGTAITQETVSGVRAVNLTASGHLQVAMASVAARMPAIGVVVDNVASGIPANVFLFGQFQFTSGLADYSGFVGTTVVVGRSGQVVTQSGSWNSGGLLSGDQYQPIGVALSSGAAMLQVDAPAVSGGPSVGSGNVGSGSVASGAVQGFFGTTRNIASGTVGVFDFGSGAVIAGAVGSGAIQSGQIASGQIGINHFASGAITSGWALGSGSIWGRLGPQFLIASGTIGTLDLSSGIITSGVYIGSGTILGQAGGGPFNIASGTVGTFDIGSGAVRSGHIASGQVPNFAVGSGAITSGRIAMGGTPNGTLFFRDDYTWQTAGGGSLTSGGVVQIDHASGLGIQFLMPMISGLTVPFTVITEETISGVRAVAVSQSGNLRVAMAGTSGRMPAIGVVVDNVASGIQANVFADGSFQFSSGMADYSGWVGTPLFVGRSGQIVSLSGSFNSGGILSGDITQYIGTALNSGAALIQVGDVFASGFFLGSGVAIAGSLGSGAVTSGSIASGSIGKNHFASGAITSGWAIGSGALFGRLGPEFLIASGTIGTFDLSSGIITSGVYIGSGTILGQAGGGPFNIASGTITSPDIGSGAILSGHIASGQVPNFAVGSGAVTSGRIGMGGTPTGTNFFRDDFTWASPGAASVTSGSVTQITFASGAGPEYLMAYVSGLNNPNSVITEETISGCRAVALSQSGHLRLAMASISGRMPAIGVVIDNVASGIQANVYTDGNFQLSSGLADYSGYIGQLLFVGRSGQVVTASGAFNSGGLLSGDVYQPIGTVLNSGSPDLSISTMLPFVPGLITSGNVASGQLADPHFASGAWIDNASDCMPLSSGGTWTAITSEAISGIKAVCVDRTNSGAVIRTAMAALSGRMPAIGVVQDNVASGIRVNVISQGLVPFGSGIMGSGFIQGRSLWVGASGDIITFSGGYGSGGHAAFSGFLTQNMGVLLLNSSGRTSGLYLINTSPNLFSGLLSIYGI